MPDKNLTDTEIKKALSICSNENGICSECPYSDDYTNCNTRIAKDALDLINRQEKEMKTLQDEYRWLDQESDILSADVENLNRICDEVNVENESLKAEVERLKNKLGPQGFEEVDPMDFCGVLCDFAEGLIEKAKAEAYKEFAGLAVERVEKAKLKYQRLCKEQGEEMEEHMHIHFNGIIGIINNLLNELVGDKNAGEN